MNSHGAALRVLSDDTVEIQLTPEEIMGLSQAAEAAQQVQAAAPMRELPEPVPLHLSSQTLGPGLKCNAAVIFAFSLFVWWGVDHVFGQQPVHAPQTTLAAVAPAAAAPELPATSASAVVKVRNPFDASEIFEFPAGTSRAESRQKVADLLLQRARERSSQWAQIAVKPAPNLPPNLPPNLRAANMYR